MNHVKRLVPGVLALCLCSCALVQDDWQPVVPGAGLGEKPVFPETPRLDLDQYGQGPIKITVEEAVLLALENNRALRLERLNPSIQRTFVQQERAVFEPVLSAGVSGNRERVENRPSRGAPPEVRDSSTGGGVALSEKLPTGTSLDIELTNDRTWGDSRSEQHATRAGLTVTQSLLQGFGVAVNLANLRQARLDTLFSEYEFRGFAEGLVAEVETTYWRYVLAQRQVVIVKESLTLAEKQLEDTRRRIRVGQMAKTEKAAAEAEVSLRRESLINAESRVETLQIRLLRLVYPQLLSTVRREVTPQTEPVVPPMPLEKLADHVAVALKLRPDLNQAALLLQRGDLEIVKTRNGLLPKMNLFVTLGKTGYARSFSRSFHDVDSDGYDVSVGIEFEYPLTNRDARARHNRALLTRRQYQQALANLRDLVRQDVELAYIEVRRTRQQVDATAETRKFQDEKLRPETAKFNVGKSTALLVAAAQRDLLASRVGEVEAVTNYLNARINLYLMEGSLLERRGLSASGGLVPITPGDSTSDGIGDKNPNDRGIPKP